MPVVVFPVTDAFACCILGIFWRDWPTNEEAIAVYSLLEALIVSKALPVCSEARSLTWEAWALTMFDAFSKCPSISSLFEM